VFFGFRKKVSKTVFPLLPLVGFFFIFTTGFFIFPNGRHSLLQKKKNGSEDDFNCGQGVPSGVVADDSGNVFVTGLLWTSIDPIDSEWVTIKYDGDGNLLWVNRELGSQGDSPVWSSDLAIDGEGNPYVTGYKNEMVSTIKYDSDGNTVWEAGFGEGPSTGELIALDQAGNVFVAGFSQEESLLIKYDLEGNPLWSLTPEEMDLVNFAVDPFGNVAITGCLETEKKAPDGVPKETKAFTTVKYNSNGEFLWGSERKGRKLGFDQEGNLYLLGTGESNEVLKYDPDGNPLWNLTEYTATFFDISVRGNGDFFVAGGDGDGPGQQDQEYV